MNTLVVVAEGLACYLGWWARALIRWRDPRAPMGPRRLAMLLLGMPVFVAIQLIHALCLLLDEVLFPRFRRVSLEGALVITGIPRSGTTFLHRTLAADTTHYTTVTTWEAILAPSILQRRLVRALAWLDGRLGHPATRCLGGLTHYLAGGLDAIHEVDLDAAEEDYLLLLPAAGCFVMLLAFPSAPGLQRLGDFDNSVSAGRQRRLLRFYRRCLQRHIHADGGHRRLLSKNAAFGSWIRGLHETLPGARFIVCIRPPDEALSSQISAVSAARPLFGTATHGAAFQRLFLDTYAATLDHLAATILAWPRDTVAVVDATPLRHQPAEVIRNTMNRLAIAETPELTRALDALPSTRSSHRHRVAELSLDADTISERLDPAYRRLLAMAHRVEASA